MVRFTLMYVHERTRDILRVLCKEYLGKTVANCLDDIVEDFIEAYNIDIDEILAKVEQLKHRGRGA